VNIHEEITTRLHEAEFRVHDLSRDLLEERTRGWRIGPLLLRWK